MSELEPRVQSRHVAKAVTLMDEEAKIRGFQDGQRRAFDDDVSVVQDAGTVLSPVNKGKRGVGVMLPDNATGYIFQGTYRFNSRDPSHHDLFLGYAVLSQEGTVLARKNGIFDFSTDCLVRKLAVDNPKIRSYDLQMMAHTNRLAELIRQAKEKPETTFAPSSAALDVVRERVPASLPVPAYTFSKEEYRQRKARMKKIAKLAPKIFATAVNFAESKVGPQPFVYEEVGPTEKPPTVLVVKPRVIVDRWKRPESIQLMRLIKGGVEINPRTYEGGTSPEESKLLRVFTRDELKSEMLTEGTMRSIDDLVAQVETIQERVAARGI